MKLSGEPARIRTGDHLIKSQMLYRLSYEPTSFNVYQSFKRKSSEVANFFQSDFLNLRDCLIRNKMAAPSYSPTPKGAVPSPL